MPLHARVCAAVFFIALSVSIPSAAQIARWGQTTTTTGGVSKSGARIQVDHWGHAHVLWASAATWGSRYDWESRDPSRAGIQLSYSSDATGLFTPPLQVTDTLTGTVFARGQNPAPWTFRLDNNGAVHAAYVANTDGRPGLYYTSNADYLSIPTHRFTQYVRLVDLPGGVDTLGFDLAVDSLGNAHVVWVDMSSGQAVLSHWSSASNIFDTLWSFNCTGASCRVGAPVAAVSRDGLLTVAVRSVSARVGAILMIRQDRFGRYGPGRWLQLSQYASELSGPTLFDLRLRMALDSSSGAHLLLPYGAMSSSRMQYRLLYLYTDSTLAGANGSNDPSSTFAVARRLFESPLDNTVRDLDIVYNGGMRVDMTWLTRTKSSAKIGYAAVVPVPNEHTAWNTVTLVDDLSAKIGAGALAWRNDVRIGSSGDRVVIAGLYDGPPIGRDTTPVPQVGILVGTTVQPTVRYLHPDAAAPGMNVVVDAVASPIDRGTFGPDSRDVLVGDSISAGQLELVHPDDAERVVLGPSVVSWDGRLLSTMIFVKPGALPGPVPLRVRTPLGVSNVDTFYVVDPVHMSGDMTGGGTIGSGRSRRGVWVVDGLSLASGVYTIDTSDCDPAMPGNQGFLPITILSKGPVRIESSATLSVSGRSDQTQRVSYAGPGGGGGGGGEISAGSGFTGGGGPIASNNSMILGASVGSGGTHSGFWSGGGSLNGAPGGESYFGASGGGGTAHPFGASGSFGQVFPSEPVDRNPGGRGGGAGGAVKGGGIGSVGGGGGGNATAGQGAELTPHGDRDANGGQVVGSRQLVPLAGGSGGGGGGFQSGGPCAGGGGGGAIAIYSFSSLLVNGTIEADGASGIRNPDVPSASGSGGGAGGAIVLGAQKAMTFGLNASVHAFGGDGGDNSGSSSSTAGGRGGDGRIRVDGRVTRLPKTFPAYFAGPASAASSGMQARADSFIVGYASPDSTLLVWKRSAGGSWKSTRTQADAKGEWRVKLTAADVAGGGPLYVVVMQRVTNPSRKEFSYEPAWVMSTAGANVIGTPAMEDLPDSLRFDCIHYRDSAVQSLQIHNTGDIADLVLSSVAIRGRDAARFTLQSGGGELLIAPMQTVPLSVKFKPDTVGMFEAELVMSTNLPLQAQRVIPLKGCATSGLWSPRQITIDLGELCVDDCVDKTVQVTNSGAAGLTVTNIAGDLGDMNITETVPAIPFTIAPNSSQSLQLRICVRRFRDNDAVLRLESNTVDSALSLMVRATNAAPIVEFPRSVDFGRTNPTDMDSCVERVVYVHNRNARVAAKLSQVVVTGTAFAIIDAPPVGTAIAPSDSLGITVRFCPDTKGTFTGTIRLVLGAGTCSLDTSFALQGARGAGRAIYVLTVPDTTTRTLIFPPTPINTGNVPQLLVGVRNVGDAIGGEATARLLSGSTEFGAGNSIAPIAVNLDGTLPVTFKPTVAGEHRAKLLLTSSNPAWSDTVYLEGRGTAPGLQTDVSVLDFGTTCVQDVPAVRTLTIFNNGESPVVIDALSVPEMPYELDSAMPNMPLVLASGDQLQLGFRFTPGAEGLWTRDFTIMSGGQPLVVRLTGSAVNGHLASSQGDLDFGCRPTGMDTVLTFTLRNTGKCPVMLHELSILPVGAGFSLMTPVADEELAPDGAEHVYRIRYVAGVGPANAALKVVSDAPEIIVVRLDGGVCNVGDIRKVYLSTAHVSAHLADTFTLPIMARVVPPSSEDISYTVTLRYAYDVLLPRLGSREDAPDGTTWGAGTISRAVLLDEPRGGTLTIKGVIRAGEVAGTLANIPMKALLGSACSTILTFEGAEATGSQVVATPGEFHATDCGDVVVPGVYSLEQNQPNPFQPVTVIRYSIGRREPVQLNLYDAAGRLVRRLVDETQGPGHYAYTFNAAGLPSGVYSYELVSGSFRDMRRMVLMR